MGMFEVSRLVALPEGFPLGACEAVLGPFPRGNPEALRAGGDAWERAARRCRSEAEELADVASSVPQCLSGDTAVEAQRVLDGSADRKRDLAVFCESKAVECRETANTIELGQFTWIVMGSALVVELLASLAMPVGGMAAAAGARAAARKGWQLAWAQLIESVIALCARLSASRAALVGQGIVVGGVFAGGVTWGGQVWQQHRGDRDTIDWETVTVSGAGGAAGGVGAGVLYTRPVAGALARLQAAGTRGANAVAMLLAGGAAGVAGGATGTLGGAVAASAYSGDLAMPDGSEFYLGAVSGALEGLLSGGVHTLGHSATPPPPPAGLFDRPARSPKPSDLAAIFARNMNARASGPSGRADLPGITAAGSAHSSSRPGDRPPAAPVSSVKPGANSVVGAAGTATDPDPAAASTEHLPPGDRSASNPSPDLTTPGVPAVAGATAYTGTDSHPGPITPGAPADHSATVPRYSTGPAADEDNASAITAVPASHGPVTTPTALVTDWATHTTGNAAATGIPPGADMAVTAADTERSTASTPPEPPVETSATPFSSGAHNRPEPQPNIPWTRTTEHSTPPRLPTPEHTPSPWQAQRNLPPEPGPSAPPTSTGTHPPTATATPTGAPSPHLPPGTIRNTAARTGHPSAPHHLTSTPDNPPHQAIDTPITTPPHLAGPGHPPGPIPYPAVLTGFGSSTDGDHAGPTAVTPDGSRLLPDVGSSAGLLGVPGSDDWTSLDPEGVAVELRRQLLETTGSDIPVLGFDPDSVDPEVAREYARVVVDNFAGAPHVVLDSIEIGPIDDGKPELVPAEVQYRPVTAADGAVRFTRHLVLDQLFAADPGKIRRLVEANSELHHFADSARIRPLYAVISHDFGHLLDRTGKTSARELADNALLQHYMAERLGPDTVEGYKTWLRENLSGYSLDPEDGGLNPGEALAEAYAQVIAVGRENVGAPVRILYDLLVRSADRETLRGRFGRFIDQVRYLAPHYRVSDAKSSRQWLPFGKTAEDGNPLRERSDTSSMQDVSSGVWSERLEGIDPAGQVRDLLAQIETGRKVLEFLDANPMIRTHFPLRAEDAPPGELGSYGLFRPHELSMETFTDGRGLIDQVLTAVHELVHAQYHIRGITALAIERQQTMSREEFVAAMVDEEAHAEAQAVRAGLELRALGYRVPRTTVEAVYVSATEQSVRHSRLTGSEADADEVHEHGIAAVRGLVGLDVNRKGMGYSRYYGDIWDRANPAAGGAVTGDEDSDRDYRYRPADPAVAAELHRSVLERRDLDLQTSAAADRIREAAAALGLDPALNETELHDAVEAELRRPAEASDDPAGYRRRQYDLRALDDLITRSAWQRSLWARAALRLEVLLARDVLTTTVRNSAAPGSGARLLTDQVAYLPGTPDRIVVAAFVNGHAGALDAARRDPDVAAILERGDIETEYRRLWYYPDGSFQVEPIENPDPHRVWSAAELTEPEPHADRVTAERIAGLRRELADTTRTRVGPWAESILRDWEVRIEYATDADNQYDPVRNTLVLDPGLSDGRQLAEMVHAAIHIEAAGSRETPVGTRHRLQTPRWDYVRSMLAEEARAHALEIIAIRELRSAGFDIPETALESAYTTAFDTERARIAARDPGRSPADLDALANIAGLQAIRPELANHRLPSGRTYAEYYSTAWDHSRGVRSMDRIVADTRAAGPAVSADGTVLPSQVLENSGTRTVEKVRYANGSELVKTYFADPDRGTAALLASVVGRAFGAAVPSAVYELQLLYQSVPPGRSADRLSADAHESVAPYADTERALVLGLLDTVTGNPGRPGAEIYVNPDRGAVAAFGHYRAFEDGGPVPSEIGPFAGYLLRRTDDGTVEYRDGALPVSVVDSFIERFATTRPAFEQHEKLDWYDQSMARLRQIRAHSRDDYQSIADLDLAQAVGSATVDSYVNRYGGGDRYGVQAIVDSAGVVRAEIRTGDNTPQGVDMFSDVLRNLGHLATEFRVEWIAADAIADDLPGYHGDGTSPPLVTRDGAVDTAISRLAAQHGFTRIDGWGESAGQPGGRRSTAVRFLRPEEPGAVDAEPVAGPERTMVPPDDSNARRPGDAPAGPANPAGERDDGDPVSGQAPPRVRGMRDIDEPPVARREGEAGAPIPRESPAADERGWRQRRVQDESELARVLYHRPETRQAVIAVIDRLRVVLSGLHPQATREQIDDAFYTPEETISGGMVLRSVPLDELRRDGNLRELMAAVQNAMWRNRDIPQPSGTTLDDGLARLLNRPDWAEQAERLGLKVDALARVRASITGGDPSAVIAAQELRFVRHAMSDPGQHAISEEIIHSGAIRGPRDTPEQRRRSLTVQDWSLLGMPLSIRELEAIPGGLVALRKTRLDPHGLLPRDNRGRVDVTVLETQLAAEDRAFRHALPLYRYDDRGRRVRDESGHAVVDGILVYHEEGTVDAATALRLDPHRFAVPLPWSPGAVRFEFDKDGEWFRRTAVERGVPAGSGVSGTAARIASRFNWIMPDSVPKQDFAGAILALLLPLHHSLYETVRGMQMVGTSVVDPAVFRASDSMVADLYRAVFDRFGISAPDESSGKQVTELIGISQATGSPSVNTPDAATEPVPPDPGEPGWRLLRLRDEVELARALYHRPESRQAAVAMLDRLREVLTALHPGAAPAEIDNAFYAPENAKAGGMVPRSVSLDEVRREGNLRELMAAVYNAMLRSGELAGNPSTTTLDDGVATLLNEKNWAEKAQRLGLDVDALGQVRTWVTGDDPRHTIGKNDIRDVRNTVRYPGDRDIADERTLSSADERERDPREQIRRGLTVQDWALLGMPLSPRELAAIPGELVALRKSRLDPGRVLPRDGRGRVDADALESELAAEDETFRFAVPLYEYDDIGRRMRDEAGDAVVSGVLVYREVGPVDADTALRLDPGEFAVPLPWGPGVSRVAFAKDGEWFRKVAVEQRVPLLAGLSGTAARLAARFLWIRPPGVSEIDAAGAILAFLSPQHHSLYEQVRGMQMSGLRLVDDAVLRSPGGSVGELYRAVFELFGVPAPEGSARVAPLAAGSTGEKPAEPHAAPAAGAEVRRPGGESHRFEEE